MRSRRSSEIQFKKSFFKFSFIFFLSLFIGLVGRYYIYNQPLDQIVSEKISQNENYKIDVQGVRIKLRQGWLPALAVFAEKIIVTDSQCISRSLEANDIFVSMNISSLFKSKFKPKSVFITEAHLITPEKCEENKSTFSTPVEKPVFVKVEKKKSVQRDGDQFPVDLFSFFKKENKLLAPPFFDIENFRVDLLRSGDVKLSVRGEMSFRNNEENFVANIYPAKVEFQGQELPLNKGVISLSLSEKAFKAHYETYIREGKVDVDMSLDNLEGFPASLSAKLVKIPISTFSRFLLTRTQLNYLWVNCEASLAAPWGEMRKKLFSLDKCNLSGPYGGAKLVSSKTSFEKMHAIEIEFDKIDLDQVVKNKRNVYFSGIFSRFGTFSGILKHIGGRWKLNAVLANSDILFSRNNFRELQKITNLPFKIASNSSGWHLSVSGVEIDQGLLKGGVEVSVDEGMKNGKGRVALHQVRLHPKIYKLMLQSESSDFSLFGKVGLEAGEVSAWEGALAAAKVTGKKFEFTGLKVEAARKAKEAPILRIQSSSGEFFKDSEVLAWLKPTTLDSQWVNEAASFKELSVRFDVTDKVKWVWQRGYMRFSNGWQLSSEGSLNESGALQGWMQWDVPKKPFLRWNYAGVFQKGKWKPEEDWMKSWLTSNRKYLLDHPSIDFIADNKSNAGEGVKSMGKKLLEKAKSVLPIESKDKNKGS